MKRAFSLVELSIVLVILGLLVGGVLSGQSLIRAAELRSVTSDLTRYVTASQTFRDKYFALPGDMTNATSFWGTDSTSCPNGGGATGTCNGNGDGIIGSPTSVGNICETQEFWRQLALAGLVEGNFTPNAVAQCFAAATFGRDSAKLRISNGGVTATYIANITSNAAWPGTAFNIGTYGNVLLAGRAGSNGVAIGTLFKPEELWNIDTKLDDAKPAYGNVQSLILGVYNAACTTSATASLAEYNLLDLGSRCSIVMKTGF